MAEEAWTHLLEAIYENEQYWRIEKSELEEVADDLNLNADIDSVLEALDSQDLIERDIDHVTLTERGFKFVSEKKTHSEQLLTQRLLLVFVTALSLSTLVDTVIKIGNNTNMLITIVYSVVFAIVFIVLGMIAKQNLN